MKTETMYCLFNFKGEPNLTTLSYYRYIVEETWMKNWDEDKSCGEWIHWYRKGWRIKKVLITLEPINIVKIETETEIKMMEVLDYEIRSSWWASFIFWSWGQTMVGNYFAWRVRRKHKRYIQSMSLEKTIKTLNNG